MSVDGFSVVVCGSPCPQLWGITGQGRPESWEALMTLSKATRNLLEAYRSSPDDTEAVLWERARKASKSAVLARSRDTDADDVVVRGRVGRVLHGDGGEVARVDHSGSVVAKPVTR